MKITYNGQILEGREVKITIDKTMIDDRPPLLDAHIAQQTLTLNFYYYRIMALAYMLEPHAPKKAKQLKNIVRRHNPLKLAGLL